MKTIHVPIQLMEGMSLPEYATPGSVGVDLQSVEEMQIPPGVTRTVSTGLRVAIPEGFEMQIRSRSGLALKGIVVANAPGTIDSDYRGEIKVILVNLSASTFNVRVGDRIAQGVFAPVVRAEFEPRDVLPATVRGDGGFGSTGI